MSTLYCIVSMVHCTESNRLKIQVLNFDPKQTFNNKSHKCLAEKIKFNFAKEEKTKCGKEEFVLWPKAQFWETQISLGEWLAKFCQKMVSNQVKMKRKSQMKKDSLPRYDFLKTLTSWQDILALHLVQACTNLTFPSAYFIKQTPKKWVRS